MNMLWKSWKLGQYVSLRVSRTLPPLFVFPLSGGGEGAATRRLTYWPNFQLFHQYFKRKKHAKAKQNILKLRF